MGGVEYRREADVLRVQLPGLYLELPFGNTVYHTVGSDSCYSMVQTVTSI